MTRVSLNHHQLSYLIYLNQTTYYALSETQHLIFVMRDWNKNGGILTKAIGTFIWAILLSPE